MLYRLVPLYLHQSSFNNNQNFFVKNSMYPQCIEIELMQSPVEDDPPAAARTPGVRGSHVEVCLLLAQQSDTHWLGVSPGELPSSHLQVPGGLPTQQVDGEGWAKLCMSVSGIRPGSGPRHITSTAPSSAMWLPPVAREAGLCAPVEKGKDFEGKLPVSATEMTVAKRTVEPLPWAAVWRRRESHPHMLGSGKSQDNHHVHTCASVCV